MKFLQYELQNLFYYLLIKIIQQIFIQSFIYISFQNNFQKYLLKIYIHQNLYQN